MEEARIYHLKYLDYNYILLRYESYYLLYICYEDALNIWSHVEELITY